MKRLTLLLLCLWSVLAGAAAAADRGRPVRIGVLTEGSGPTSGSVGLRDGLKELGYQEDKDFVIGVRFTQGSSDELPAAARQLVEQGVDVLFTEGRSAAKVAQKETTKIPIVFAGGGDPVGLGLIQSFARPGGNVTGVTDLDLEIGAKRLEVFSPTLLKDIEEIVGRK